ncbi:hypothetical protein SLEP1_g41353 [Rubroshorea leprosula]|uniref:Uncharacterized protein n=1 Tax=Rubroshorea leprosula TaxID=152421 RepID=A0AAV5L688_9ROSI|nr:hypothetical protein SLEP1_g41353 [Rubroshorea leprosula]
MSNREKGKKIRNDLPQDAVLKAISGLLYSFVDAAVKGSGKRKDDQSRWTERSLHAKISSISGFSTSNGIRLDSREAIISGFLSRGLSIEEARVVTEEH